MAASSFTTDEIPTEFDDAVRRFEGAWRDHPRPDIGNYVPAPRAGHVRLLFELVHIDLDLRLRGHEAALVENYLERFPELERDRTALLELIADEYALRRHWGGTPEPGEYLRRFPQFSTELRDRLDTEAGGAFRSQQSAPAMRLSAALVAVPGYEIVRELGRGGMGVVYEARQVAADRVVAIKEQPSRPTVAPSRPPAPTGRSTSGIQPPVSLCEHFRATRTRC